MSVPTVLPATCDAAGVPAMPVMVDMAALMAGLAATIRDALGAAPARGVKRGAAKDAADAPPRKRASPAKKTAAAAGSDESDASAGERPVGSKRQIEGSAKPRRRAPAKKTAAAAASDESDASGASGASAASGAKKTAAKKPAAKKPAAAAKEAEAPAELRVLFERARAAVVAERGELVRRCRELQPQVQWASDEQLEADTGLVESDFVHAQYLLTDLLNTYEKSFFALVSELDAERETLSDYTAVTVRGVKEAFGEASLASGAEAGEQLAQWVTLVLAPAQDRAVARLCPPLAFVLRHLARVRALSGAVAVPAEALRAIAGRFSCFDFSEIADAMLAAVVDAIKDDVPTRPEERILTLTPDRERLAARAAKQAAEEKERAEERAAARAAAVDADSEDEDDVDMRGDVSGAAKHADSDSEDSGDEDSDDSDSESGEDSDDE